MVIDVRMNIRSVIYLPFFVLVSLLLLAPISAQEDSEETGFFELEAILDIQVSVGSKKQEKAAKTPAIVSVITAQDIQDLGYTNLYQVLATVPGIEFIESYYGSSMLIFRGAFQEHFNNKSLVLINGRPIYEPTYGTYFLEQVPLNSIERIEIIRGPGSSLYGANAYTGLINIITKRDLKTKKVSTQNKVIVYADRDDGNKVKPSIYASVGIQEVLAEGMSVSLFATGNWQDAFKYQGIGGRQNTHLATPPIDTVDYYNNYANLYSTFKWDELEVNAFYFYQNKAKLSVSDSTAAFLGGDNNIHVVGGDASFKHPIVDKLDASYKLYVDYYARDLYFDYRDTSFTPANATYDGSRIGFTGDLLYTYNEIYSGILGVYTEYQNAGSFAIRNPKTIPLDESIITPFSSRQQNYDVAAYLQLKATYNIVSFTTGLRYNYNQYYGNNVVARGGINFTLLEEGDHGLYLKALYGGAVRNPSFFERFSESAFIVGSPELAPESIHTIDGAVEYLLASFLSLRMNYYYMRTGDFIQRQVQRQGQPPQYINSLGQQFHGMEFDAQYFPLFGKHKKDLKISTNASYRIGANLADNTRVDNLAAWLFNGRVEYTLMNLIQTGVILQYIAPRTGIISHATGTSRVTVDGYLLTNLNIKWLVTSTQRVEFAVNNVADVKYFYPEVVFGRAREVAGVTPFYGGRYFSVSYSGEFDL